MTSKRRNSLLSEKVKTCIHDSFMIHSCEFACQKLLFLNLVLRFWNDLPDWLTHRRWAVAAAYGLGVVVIILSV